MEFILVVQFNVTGFQSFSENCDKAQTPDRQSADYETDSVATKMQRHTMYGML